LKGFFYQKEKKNKTRQPNLPGAKKRSGKKDQRSACEECGLYKTCQTPKMPPSGEGRKKILIIAEAPGKSEDELGSQLVGDAGKTLRKTLDKHGIDLDKDCWKTNAIICRPPKNKTPTNRQVALCHKYLDETIRKYHPEKIIILGKIAMQSFLHERDSVSSMEKWVGWTIPDQKYQCWVFPTYHPQYLNYNSDNKVLHALFNRHIRTAVEWEKEFPEESFEPELIFTKEGAIEFLKGIKGKYVSIDYETTGLKPYADGHKILCLGVTYMKGSACFPFFDDPEFIEEVRKLMLSTIGKVGHNIKYEDVWTNILLGVPVNNWVADTMIDCHIADNRSGITGLKFQIYVNFGVIGYDKEAQKYISSKGSGNDKNKMEEMPLAQLLRYCGLDSYYGYRLYRKDQERSDAKEFFLKGQKVLSKIERNGIYIDEDYYHSQMELLQRKMDKFKEKINNSDEAKIWTANFKENFNFNSSKQLQVLLFDLLGIKSEKETETGQESTDTEVLENIGTEFTKNIVQYKKLYKLRNTYVTNFIEETDKRFLHPMYNLNTAISFRGSSSNPNFQNIPVRDELAQKVTRKGIIPRPGRRLMEVDYSGIEVRISACNHKDPKMISYIKDPSSDMHRDMAREIFELDEVSKIQRYLAKNKFVFPQFYGDYYVNSAKAVWKEAHDQLKFKTYEAFEKHMKKVEYDFWNNRFQVYNEWKNETWQEYQRKGYVDLLSGFRCRGLYTKNEVLNFPMQGPAFHCLLWSIIHVQEHLEKEKMDSLIIGQIHDSMVLDAVPDEVEDLKPAIKRIMCDDIREYWPWIIVPLDIEMDIAGIDEPWNKKQKEEI
jgi:uracil-DNA glycosylase family 4